MSQIFLWIPTDCTLTLRIYPIMHAIETVPHLPKINYFIFKDKVLWYSFDVVSAVRKRGWCKRGRWNLGLYFASVWRKGERDSREPAREGFKHVTHVPGMIHPSIRNRSIWSSLLAKPRHIHGLGPGSYLPSPGGVSKWRANEARLSRARGILALYDHIPGI